MRTPCGQSEFGSSSKALGGNGSRVIRRSVLICKINKRVFCFTHELSSEQLTALSLRRNQCLEFRDPMSSKCAMIS